jgi:hypothetical protein
MSPVNCSPGELLLLHIWLSLFYLKTSAYCPSMSPFSLKMETYRLRIGWEGRGGGGGLLSMEGTKVDAEIFEQMAKLPYQNVNKGFKRVCVKGREPLSSSKECSWLGSGIATVDLPNSDMVEYFYESKPTGQGRRVLHAF